MTTTTHFNLPKPVDTADVDEEFYRLQQAWDLLDSILKSLQDAVNAKAAASHNHAIADVIDLSAQLAAKMPASATFSLDSLTDVEGAAGAPVGYVLAKSALGWLPSSALAALGPHGHLISEITGLVDALALKANANAVLRHDVGQSLSAAAQGLARANMGAGILAGHRNKLINGNFDIWQRSSSFTSGSAFFGPDRWNFRPGIGGVSLTVARNSFSSGSIIPHQPAYGCTIQRDITGTASCYIRQPIEDVRTLSGKEATFTIWVACPVAATLPVTLTQYFGPGGSPNVVTSVGNLVLNGTGVITRYDFVFDVPSTAGKTINNNSYALLEIEWPTTEIGNGVGWTIAAASLVAGDATAEESPISLRDVSEEEHLCMWYYAETIAHLRFYSGGSGHINEKTIYYPRQMRIAPSVAGPSGGSTGNVSSGLTAGPTRTGVRFQVISNTTGDCFYLNGKITLNAELL